MLKCEMCGAILNAKSTGRPRQYCNSCGARKRKREERRRQQFEEYADISTHPHKDLAFMHLIFAMAESCKKESPCDTCTIEYFCPVVKRLVA